jgi:myo-inositol-1(or 4)-monophosphatase
MNEKEIAKREKALRVIARDAGQLARRFFLKKGKLSISLKGTQDYLTVADGAVERFIVRRLNKAFPEDALLGEEGGRKGSQSDEGALWIIDPIDGTENFAHGIGHFCVSIGLMVGRRLELAAICSPIYGELYLARRGHGATLNGRRMKVCGTRGMRRSVIELGWSARVATRPYTALVERVLASGATFRRAGSGALGLAYVADGRTEGYCELHINAWDVAAGILLVEEAGGWVNDFFAGDGLARGNEIIAAAPGIRKALVAVTGMGKGKMTARLRNRRREK